MLFTEAKDRAPALQWCVAASTWPARPPRCHWSRLGNLLLRIHSKSLRVNNSLPAPAKRKRTNGQARRETTCLDYATIPGGDDGVEALVVRASVCAATGVASTPAHNGRADGGKHPTQKKAGRGLTEVASLPTKVKQNAFHIHSYDTP